MTLHDGLRAVYPWSACRTDTPGRRLIVGYSDRGVSGIAEVDMQNRVELLDDFAVRAALAELAKFAERNRQDAAAATSQPAGAEDTP